MLKNKAKGKNSFFGYVRWSWHLYFLASFIDFLRKVDMMERFCETGRALRLSIDIGFSQSQQKISSEQYTAAPSSLTTGRDLSSRDSMQDYLREAARITQLGGEIVINGTARNSFFNSIPTAQQLDALGLSISYQGALLPEFQGMSFVTTEGKRILPSSMNTIKFTKKLP